MSPRSPAANAILALLAARNERRTICPSEAARRLDSAGWRDAMPEVHVAARELVAQGEAVLTQRGDVVAPGAIVGAYRIRKV